MKSNLSRPTAIATASATAIALLTAHSAVFAQSNVTLSGRVDLNVGKDIGSKDRRMGSGAMARFGIQYSGSYDTSNFVGVDSLVVTSVPEPATGLMFGAGLLGLMAMRRRRNRA